MFDHLLRARMAKITALIHTHNDAERIARTLESLRACDELLVIDHASTDDTLKVAREHGAVVKEGVPGVNPGVYAVDARHDWILCLLPTEAVSEGMEASLFEWKRAAGEKARAPLGDADFTSPVAFCFRIRQEDGDHWKDLPPETRLVNRTTINWPGELPAPHPGAKLLDGYLLRFASP